MLRFAIILHIGITGTPAPAKPLPCQFKVRPVPIAFVIRSLRSSYSVPNSVSFFVSASAIPPLNRFKKKPDTLTAGYAEQVLLFLNDPSCFSK